MTRITCDRCGSERKVQKIRIVNYNSQVANIEKLFDLCEKCHYQLQEFLKELPQQEIGKDANT